MTYQTTENVTGHRVDVLDQKESAGVSLCFRKTARAARTICPGAHVLGRTQRHVALPWVAQVGDSSTAPWLQRLSTPAPTLGDLRYLQH